MNRLFFYFISFLFAPLIAFSIGFSPSTINYELSKGQESCEKAKITTEDLKDFEVYDRWAPLGVEGWNEKEFTEVASTHSIAINYPSFLEDVKGEKTVDVCVKGSEIGNYKGIIIFEGSTETNVALAAGIWLNVNVKESTQEEITTNPSQDSSNSQSNNKNTEIQIETNEENTQIQLTAEQPKITETEQIIKTTTQNTQKEATSKITGKATKPILINQKTELLTYTGYAIGGILILSISFIIIRRLKK